MTIAAFLAAATVTACSGAPSGDGPDYEVLPATGTDGGAKGDGGADAAAAAPVTFRASLPSTPTFPFGGGEYCNYEIRLEQVEVELTMLGDGNVTAGTLKDVAVEKGLACKYEHSPPSQQSFTFAQSVRTPSGARVDFTGAPENQPKTSLVAELVRRDKTYEAILSWKRTDQVPALTWAVTATVPLSPK